MIIIHKNLLKALTSILVLNYLFFVSDIAWANLIGNFKVSKKATKVSQRRTIGTGSRSKCIPSITSANGIELLVPNFSVAHQTISENPSLYLYFRANESVSVAFTLIDPTTPQPLVEKRIKIEKPGIKKISLPLDIKLKSNNVYLWYIAIPCKNTPQYYQTVLNAGIERVNIAPNIATKLSNSTSNLEKIEIYNANSLWYETIDLAIQDLSEQEVNTFLDRNIFSRHSKIEKDI